MTGPHLARVAQLDRALASGARGRRFESCRAYLVNRRHQALFAGLLFAAALPGCGAEDGEAGEIGGSRSFDFASGQFELHTLSTDDLCLGGAMNVLFMPEGAATPWKWEFPVDFHAPEDLPKTYDVPLRQPFGTISVTFEAVSKSRERARGAQNTGVLLNEAQFGSCVADLDADMDIRLESATQVAGEGKITMANPRGDERCPVMSDPCELVLVFQGQRL